MDRNLTALPAPTRWLLHAASRGLMLPFKPRGMPPGPNSCLPLQIKQLPDACSKPRLKWFDFRTFKITEALKEEEAATEVENQEEVRDFWDLVCWKVGDGSGLKSLSGGASSFTLKQECILVCLWMQRLLPSPLVLCSWFFHAPFFILFLFY